MSTIVIQEKRSKIFKYFLMFSALFALTGWFAFDIYKSVFFKGLISSNIAFIILYTLVCFVTLLSFSTFVYLFAKLLFPSCVTIDKNGIKSKGHILGWKQISSVEYLTIENFYKHIFACTITLFSLTKILSPFVIISYLWDLAILRKMVQTNVIQFKLKTRKINLLDIDETFLEKQDKSLLNTIQDYKETISDNRISAA